MKTRNLELIVILTTVAMTVLFHFVDPQEFLRNLGYASLAMLSLIELVRIVLKGKGWGE